MKAINWRKAATSVILAGVVSLLFHRCGPGEQPEPDDPYAFQAPDHFLAPTYTFRNNPVSEEGFLLGKALFYDASLSRDGSISCNSCHQQALAFADNPAHPTSIGVDNQRGSRNAPALANLAFYPEFFWDGGVNHLDFVPINAIESPIEMDESLAEVVARLNANARYRDRFREAFGIETITAPYLLQALSQFMLLMVSDQSPYDDYLRGEGEGLTELELQGMALFEDHCGGCHAGPLQTDFSYRNNGLDSVMLDLGRGRITEHPADEGKFRVPSLRNVALTAPYMHNARFATLEAVLQHYASGIRPSATLDPEFLSPEGAPKPMALTAAEQQAIVAFLHTLTDRDFTTNPLFRHEND